MDIFIEGTQNTPTIFFSAEKSSWMVSGRSYNKEPRACFEPLLTWLETVSGPGSYLVEFKLEFFDTGSFKVILDILHFLKRRLADNLQLSVRWFYETDDEDMRESGESLREITRLPLELVSY